MGSTALPVWLIWSVSWCISLYSDLAGGQLIALYSE